MNEGVEQSGAVGTVGFVVSVCDLQYDTVQGTIDVSRAEPALRLLIMTVYTLFPGQGVL